MAATMQFDLVSPERNMVSGPATLVQAPGVEGDLGVMPGHAPFLTTLRPGIVNVTLEGGEQKKFVVFGGALQADPETTTILADDVHPFDDVTTEMVDKRIADAEAALGSSPDQEVVRRAQTLSDMRALKDLHLK